ncbi:M55 family metallopeptidase [Candidatus Poribacteria bacterium]
MKTKKGTKAMKAYIMVDFEGTTGMIEWDDYFSQDIHRFEKRQRLRRILTQEVNAAVEGCLAAGVDYVLVWDSHGPSNNCNNLYFEDLNEACEVIIGWKGLPSFYPLLDDSFDCGLYIGGHAMAGTPYAVLPHTRTLVNDTPLGEVGAFALACGSLGIPMVFISGDQSVEKEVRALIPNVHSVVVKEAFSPYSAKILVPARARKLIRQEVEHAVSDRKNVPSFDFEKPYRIKIGDEDVSADNFLELFNTKLLKYSPLGSQELDPQRQTHSEMRKQEQATNYSK